MYGILLKGVFLCCQVFGRVMLDQQAGSIVNICSMSGWEAVPAGIVYPSQGWRHSSDASIGLRVGPA